MVLSTRPRVAFATRKKVLDQFPLLVRKFVPPHRWTSLLSVENQIPEALLHSISANSDKINVNIT
jgi:hypothetical protein